MLAVVFAFGVVGWLVVSHLPSYTANFTGAEGQPVQKYIYPSPSYWPLKPYPLGDGSVKFHDALPTDAPCPAGEVPTTALQNGLYVPACTIPGGVPPDPHTGPVLSSPDPNAPTY